MNIFNHSSKETIKLTRNQTVWINLKEDAKGAKRSPSDVKPKASDQDEEAVTDWMGGLGVANDVGSRDEMARAK